MVEISDLFSVKRMNFNSSVKTKLEIIDELIELLVFDDKISDRAEFKKAVLFREEQVSTGIGMSIAIPHAKGSMVKEAAIAFIKCRNEIQFDSIDNEPARLFFIIAVPEGESEVHLKVISSIARRLMHKVTREALMNCETYEEFINIMMPIK